MASQSIVKGIEQGRRKSFPVVFRRLRSYEISGLAAAVNLHRLLPLRPSSLHFASDWSEF